MASESAEPIWDCDLEYEILGLQATPAKDRPPRSTRILNALIELRDRRRAPSAEAKDADTRRRVVVTYYEGGDVSIVSHGYPGGGGGSGRAIAQQGAAAAQEVPRG